MDVASFSGDAPSRASRLALRQRRLGTECAAVAGNSGYGWPIRISFESWRMEGIGQRAHAVYCE